MNQANQYKKDSGKEKEIDKLITTNGWNVYLITVFRSKHKLKQKAEQFLSIRLTQTTVKDGECSYDDRHQQWILLFQ